MQCEYKSPGGLVKIADSDLGLGWLDSTCLISSQVMLPVLRLHFDRQDFIVCEDDLEVWTLEHQGPSLYV